MWISVTFAAEIILSEYLDMYATWHMDRLSRCRNFWFSHVDGGKQTRRSSIKDLFLLHQRSLSLVAAQNNTCVLRQAIRRHNNILQLFCIEEEAWQTPDDMDNNYSTRLIQERHTHKSSWHNRHRKTRVEILYVIANLVYIFFLTFELRHEEWKGLSLNEM